MRTITRRSEAAPYVAALAIAIAFFAIVEMIRPYYFLQDDNRQIFLPLYSHNYRAALDGQLSQFNFFQSLGKPHFATGQAATLHPLPYFSIFLSEALLGHLFGAVDILVLLYLLLGATGMVFLLRRLGFTGAAGVLCATAWCFGPFNMMTSQSWATYAPMIGLLPWVLAATLMVYRARTNGAMATFVVAHLAVFYVGAPQFFLYTGLIEMGVFVWMVGTGLHAKTLDRAALLRTTMAFVSLTILVTALAMPLLLPMWQHTQLSAFRGRPMPFVLLQECRLTITQLLNGLFLPFMKLYEPIGDAWCETYFPASFTHQGYVATLLLLAYPFVRRHIDHEQRRVIDGFVAVGVLFLLGSLGVLTSIVSIIPVINRFRWPFKYFGFANFLLLIAIAPAFDTLLSRLRGRARLATAFALVVLLFVNLTYLDLTFPRQAFFEHTDPVPLQEPLRERLRDGRTVSVGCRSIPGKTPKMATISTLGFDYATLWELHYFGGYDPLVPYANYRLTLSLDYNAVICSPPEYVPVEYLRQWGVRYYIVNEPHVTRYEPFLLAQGMRRVHTDQQRVLLEDPRAFPLAASRDCDVGRLSRDGDDLVATVSCRETSAVVFQFLYNPFFAATIDRQPSPLIETPMSHTALQVPAGRHQIRIAYDDPWIDEGFAVALAALAITALMFLLYRKRRGARS